MQITFALAALAAFASSAVAAPASCSSSFSGSFEITVVNATVSKRDLMNKRQASSCGADGILTLTLANGQLTDAKGRTGYIAANYQFQFDAPPQAGALSTGGYSTCANGSLALGDSAVFYECLSGTFYNLYDRSWAAQCSPILIYVMPCSSSQGNIGQQTDGQTTGTTVLPVVSQIGDGQPQGASPVPVPVSQISDGQPQVVSVLPGPPVTQISDGQVQATTAVAGVPVTQISDGQVQATATNPVTGAPVSQKTDGQPNATPATPISAAPTPVVSNGTSSGGSSTPKPPTAPSTLPASSANGMAVASSFAAIIFGFAAVLLL